MHRREGIEAPPFARAKRKRWSGFTLLVLLFMAVPGLHAQVDAGSVQGRVTDSSGAVIPGAVVTLRNEGTGVTEAMHADDHGSYSFSPVRIGVYAISAEMQGFERLEREHVRVDTVLWRDREHWRKPADYREFSYRI
jgi:hypothetical protein